MTAPRLFTEKELENHHIIECGRATGDPPYDFEWVKIRAICVISLICCSHAAHSYTEFISIHEGEGNEVRRAKGILVINPSPQNQHRVFSDSNIADVVGGEVMSRKVGYDHGGVRVQDRPPWMNMSGSVESPKFCINKWERCDTKSYPKSRLVGWGFPDIFYREVNGRIVPQHNCWDAVYGRSNVSPQFFFGGIFRVSDQFSRRPPQAPSKESKGNSGKSDNRALMVVKDLEKLSSHEWEDFVIGALFLIGVVIFIANFWIP